jgi:hypothetical protein
MIGNGNPMTTATVFGCSRGTRDGFDDFAKPGDQQ